MGKAARAKRDRREGGPDGGPRPVLAHEPKKRQLPVFWIVVGLVLLGGIVALVATRPSSDESKAVKAAQGAPAFAEVDVTGDQLDTFSTGNDPAEGDRLPTISGTSTDDTPIRLDAAGGAQVIVTLAHWCPHCQAEVPRIVDWAKDGKLPGGVTITALSTAASEDRPNFPPAAWLATEKWPYETMVDDEAGTAASALGVEGFPFITFVDADGNVTERFSGEMPIADFDKAVQRIAPAA